MEESGAMSEIPIPRLCAELSALAYEGLTTENVAPFGLTWCMVFERGASQAYLVGNRDRVFAVFRGTDEWRDMVTDLRYVKTAFLSGRAHKGFLAAFDAVWPDIDHNLKSLDPRLPVIFTGHSLGASEALFGAARHSGGSRQGRWGGIDEVHVFGCPRAGNADFVKILDGVKVTRYAARLDPVTRVPPLLPTPIQIIHSLGCRRLPSFYRHAGRAVSVKASGHGMDGYLAAMRTMFPLPARR